jgi:hypothetical protein
MAAKAGKSGWVKVSTDAVAFVAEWSGNIENAALETSGLGVTARTFIGQGLPLSTGSLTWQALDQSDTATHAIFDACLSGALVTLTLSDDGTNHYEGSEGAILTNFGTSVPVDGLVTGTCSWTLSGTITYGA